MWKNLVTPNLRFHSHLLPLYFTSRVRQTDMPCHWSTKHQRCHSLPQILQGAWPHEQCPRFSPSWGTEALSYPGLLASRLRSRKELVESAIPSRKLSFWVLSAWLPQGWNQMQSAAAGLMSSSSGGRNPDNILDHNKETEGISFWLDNTLTRIFCLGLLCSFCYLDRCENGPLSE